MPADATVVVVAGPKTDLLPGEIEALKAYLAKGGKVMLLLDPPEKADAAPLSNLVALAHDWAIDVGNDVVVDASGMGRLLGTDATVPVAVDYPSHPIVQDMDLLTAFPLARSVTPVTGGVNGRFAQAFVETSAQSWAEKDLTGVLAGGTGRPRRGQGRQEGPDRRSLRPCRRRSAAPAARREAGRGRPEAGVAAGRVRRLGFRVQLGARQSAATATSS